MATGRIVSIHGYNSSHDGNFEGAIIDYFSQVPGVMEMNLAGHARGQVAPKFLPLQEVISKGVEDIHRLGDKNTYLAGVSFAGYLILEALRTGAQAKGIILVKPMIDTQYTMGRPREELEPIRHILKPEEAIRAYPYGTEKQPFDLYIPALILPGTGDDVVGDETFIRKRLRSHGKELTLKSLQGPHDDPNHRRRRKDIETTVESISAFLERTMPRDRTRDSYFLYNEEANI